MKVLAASRESCSLDVPVIPANHWQAMLLKHRLWHAAFELVSSGYKLIAADCIM